MIDTYGKLIGLIVVVTVCLMALAIVLTACLMGARKREDRVQSTERNIDL